MQGLHAQNHRCQGAAQNLRVGKPRPCIKLGLCVKPDRNAIGYATATPAALIRCCLADRLNQQLLHFLTVAIALNPCRTSINHEANTGHRERGLRDVGGEHHTPLATRLKNTVLFRLTQP